jgi:hypothetical protein
MGTWGIGVWQDDVTADVIRAFADLLKQGRTPVEAVQNILEDPPWGWGDQDDDVVQILALAALALQQGVLDSALRARAISLIESGIESSDPLDRWTESQPEQFAARQEALEHFKALLVRGTATADELASVTESEAFNNLR